MHQNLLVDLAKENRPKKRASSLSMKRIGCYTDAFVQVHHAVLAVPTRPWIQRLGTECDDGAIEKKLLEHESKSIRSFPWKPFNNKL
jgi:hypothetical protein